LDRNYWEKVTQERLARRRLLKSGAALSMGAAALALVGCGDDDDDGDGGGGASPTAAPGTSPTAAAGTPKSGGVMEVGMIVDLTDLEPHVGIAAHGDTLNIAFETPTNYDTELNPVGILAESWEVNDDATEFVFHIRPGVMWHPFKGTSREFIASDIVYNFDRVKDPESGGFGQLRSFVNSYSGWEAPDDSTFILRADVPRPTTFDGLIEQRQGLPEWLEDKANNPTAMVGTGPFMLGEWRPGDQFNLLRWADSWMADKTYLDEMIFHVSLDPQTMITQLESGALHAAKSPSARDWARWRDGNEIQALVQQVSGGYYSCGYNVTYEPFFDKRARQAMAYLMDKDRFRETVMLDTTITYSLPWPETSIAYDADKVQHYNFDLDKAKELLAEVGLEDGFQAVAVMTAGRPEFAEYAEVYQQDLAQAGIELEINVMEVAAFVELINADPPGQKGLWFANAGRTNLGAPITMVNSTNVLWDNKPNGDLKRSDGTPIANNNTGYYSPEWEAVVDEINATVDEEQLKDLYQTMNDIILEDCWIAFLGAIPERYGALNEVQGIVPLAVLPGMDLTGAWLDV
jgi:peptide/nickel transport system substrate-binding protein